MLELLIVYIFRRREDDKTKDLDRILDVCSDQYCIMIVVSNIIYILLSYSSTYNIMCSISIYSWIDRPVSQLQHLLYSRSMKFPVAILAGVKTQTAEAMLTVGKVPLAKIAAVLAVSALLPFLLNKYGAKLTMGDVLYRWTWVVAFAINVICVSIPGRFDGQMVDGKIAVVWKSAFAPSGWAFAIWCTFHSLK